MATGNFLLLIGAPKSGTTSLASWMARHPSVTLMPGKEPGYFRTLPESLIINAHHPTQVLAPDPASAMINFDTYMAPAKAAVSDQWILDASTDYLSDEAAAQRIAAFAESGNVKLICVLRDPVERALSEYRHTIRDGIEPLSFQDTVAEEEARKRAHYQPLFFHVRRSQFYRDIQRYRALFADNLLLLSLAEFSDMDRCASKIFEFVGLQPAELGGINQENATIDGVGRTTPTSQLRNAYRRLRKISGLSKTTPLPAGNSQTTEEDRRLLKSLLLEDIQLCMADPMIPTDDWRCIEPAKVVKSG